MLLGKEQQNPTSMVKPLLVDAALTKSTDCDGTVQTSIANDATVTDSLPKEELASEFAVAKIAGSLLFCVQVNEGMLLTFFMSWCVGRGMAFSEIGRGMGCMSIGMLCMAPFAPTLILKWGPHRVQYYASWAFIVVRLCYLFLIIIPDALLYPTICALCFCMGCAGMLSESGSSAWTLTSVAPDKRTQAMGILLGTRGSADLIAPAIGGTAYDMGGFCFPIVAGALMFTMVLIAKRKTILKEIPKEGAIGVTSERSGSILRSRRVCICLAINSMVMFSFFACGMFFQPYLFFKYGLPAWKYGIMMSSFAIIFVVAASIAAQMERTCGPKVTLMVGSLTFSVGLLMFGPSPYLPFLPAPAPSTIWVPCLALVMVDAGFGVILSILSPLTLNYASHDGWSENEAAAQNGMFNVLVGGCCYGLGTSCGGSLVQAIGVGATASVLAMTLPLLVAFALVLL